MQTFFLSLFYNQYSTPWFKVYKRMCVGYMQIYAMLHKELESL
jgi:hypothetical protein